MWTEGDPVREVLSFRGARRMGFGRIQPGMVGMVLNPHFRADYLPEPIDPKTQLALALHREVSRRQQSTPTSSSDSSRSSTY